MGNIILDKRNGIVEELERKKLKVSKPYITFEENCFRKELGTDKKTRLKAADINLLRRQINKATCMISKLETNFVENVFSMIKSATSKRDIKNICNYFLENYFIMLDKKLITKDEENGKAILKYEREKSNEDIKNNFDIFASVLIKSMIKIYYSNILLSCSNDDLYEIYKLKTEGASADDLFEKIGEKFEPISDKNGVKDLSSKIFLNIIYDIYDRRQVHLCWENCENASPDRCLKIADEKKQKINKYDFIIDGYQVLNENDVDTFIVTKCSNYKVQKPKTFTKDQLKSIKASKEAIMLYYFDAGDVNEARNIQKFLKKTGQITSSKKEK